MGPHLSFSLLTQESHQIDLPLLTTEKESRIFFCCKVSCSGINTKGVQNQLKTSDIMNGCSLKSKGFGVLSASKIVVQKVKPFTVTIVLLATRIQNGFDLKY